MDAVTRESRARIAQKYDRRLENELRAWVQAQTHEVIHGDFMQGLKNGVILCKLVNCRYNNPGMAFKERENLERFNQKCRQLGLNDSDLFVSQDLYEGDNPTQVLQNLDALRTKLGGGLGARAGGGGYTGRSHAVRDTPKMNSSTRVYDAKPATSNTAGSFGLRNNMQSQPAAVGGRWNNGGRAGGGGVASRWNGGQSNGGVVSGGGGAAAGGGRMKFCGECGAAANGAKFCQMCGSKI